MKAKALTYLAAMAVGLFNYQVLADHGADDSMSQTNSSGRDGNNRSNSGSGRDGSNSRHDDNASGRDGNDDRGGHEGEAHEIEGHEAFRGHIVLLPTANAPANVRASAELEQENEEGSVFYKVEIRSFGLPAGTYGVTAVLLSDGSTISLGDINVASSRSARSDLQLPAGVSASDIGQIIVSDGSGNAVLTGDVNSTTASNAASFKSNVRLTPGAGAPQAKGKAAINVNQKRGRKANRFTLVASKLQPNTTFNVLVNGTQVGTATSNRRGSLSIRDLNADLLEVQNVSLVSTSDDTEAASAHF